MPSGGAAGAKRLRAASPDAPFGDRYGVLRDLPAGFRDMEEVHTLMRLAATPVHAIVALHDAMAQRQAGAEPPPDGGDEAAWHAYSLRERARDLGPPAFRRFKVGTFARDADGEIFELRRLSLTDPRLHLPEGEPYGAKHGNNAGVAKYRRWMRAGSMPPPARALETESGHISVRDGHHRASALRRSGRTLVEAWVGLTHNIVKVRSDGTTYTVPRGVTHESARALVAELAQARRRGR